MVTLKELTARMDVPIVMAGQEGFIQKVNQKFEETFHWPSRKIVGQLLAAIIPNGLKNGHHMGFSRFLNTEKPTLLNQPLDLEIVFGTGEQRSARHFTVAEKIDGSWVFGAKIELRE